jgi:hypothetical protein
MNAEAAAYFARVRPPSAFELAKTSCLGFGNGDSDESKRVMTQMGHKGAAD